MLSLLLLALTGCSRSPKEQLAFQHAEEQYQINQRAAERFRQARAAAADEDAEPVRRSREDDE
nr:hypothetical protein [Herbaspirillum sp. LeCh32-8]